MSVSFSVFRRPDVIAGVLDMRSTDPVIELRRQPRELSWWHPKQRLDLVRG